MSEESNYDIKTIKEISVSERLKLKRHELLSTILHTSNVDFEMLNDSIKELTKIVIKYKAEVESNSPKLIKLNTEKTVMEGEIKQLRLDVSDLLRGMNDSEQRSRITNVKIVGLHAPSVSETDESVFINFCNDVLEVELAESDFEAVHVVPSKRKDNKHVVIASCKSRKTKKVILNNKFKVREFNDGKNPHETMFLYKQLSPANRKIFALASKKKYDLNYKFIWTRRGTTYLRKDESVAGLSIFSEDDSAKSRAHI